MTPSVARAARIIRESVSPGTGLTAVLTLVLWLGCFGVGLFGFVLPYVRPHAAPAANPVTVEILSVELTQDMTPPDKMAGSASTAPDPMAQPDIPPPVTVAHPSAAIAFALPVEGPAQVVEARHASYTRSAPVTAAPPAPTRLTFGQGEGKQPAPEYPMRARREGQEGMVNVRFVVDESGRVQTAQALQSSPWPLLNESALNTIRGRWQFKPGKLRAYEVSIRFELTR